MADWRTVITSMVHTRYFTRGVTGVVLAVILIGLVMMGLSLRTPDVSEVVNEPPVAVPAMERSLPTLLRIPTLNLETTFVAPLRLNEDQTVEVPTAYDQVGWYGLGASPGEKGAAVILGHVDSVTGPAVFYSLGQLAKGDEIVVSRADGTTATFVVYDFERVAQENFPTEKVYVQTAGPELRLVTCTGTFLRGERRYTHNLVVYAILKAVETPAEVI